jgi:hypothetical protein
MFFAAGNVLWRGRCRAFFVHSFSMTVGANATILRKRRSVPRLKAVHVIGNTSGYGEFKYGLLPKRVHQSARIADGSWFAAALCRLLLQRQAACAKIGGVTKAVFLPRTC